MSKEVFCDTYMFKLNQSKLIWKYILDVLLIILSNTVCLLYSSTKWEHFYKTSTDLNHVELPHPLL